MLESPEWKGFRPRRLQRELPMWITRCLAAVAIGGFLSFRVQSVDAQVSVIFLFAAATAFWRATRLTVELYSSSRLRVFACLPLSNAQVFTLQWKLFLKESLFSVLDFTVLYIALAIKIGYGWNSPLAGLALGVAQYLMVIALATCFVAYLPRRRFDLFMLFCMLLIGGLVFAGSSFGSVAKTLAGVASWIPPTSWILYVVGVTGGHGFLGDFWPALGTAVILMLLPIAYTRLRNRFVSLERALASPEAARQVQTSLKVDSYDDPAKLEALRARIRSRAFLAPLGSAKLGWLDKLILGSLSAEQRLNCEFLCAGRPSWTKSWTFMTVVAIAAAVILCVSPGSKALLPFLVIFFLTLFRQFSSKTWPGISLQKIGGVNISRYCIYPVGLKQIVSVMLKANLVRLSFFGPVLLAAVCLPNLQARVAASNDTIMFSLKVLLGLLVLQPVFAIMSLATGTNHARSVKFFPLFASGFACLAACGVGLLAVPSLSLAAAALVVILVLSTGLLRFYQHGYNQNWFDLQTKPRERRQAAQSQP